MSFKTEQEEFWSGQFGEDYISRNQSEQLVIRRVVHFGRFLRSAPDVKSIIELGCNVGMNLDGTETAEPGIRAESLRDQC